MGCEALIIHMLFVMLFPIIVLVANMHFAPLGWKYYLFTVAHLLADPIDSLFSLLTKLEIARRSVALAREKTEHEAIDYATVLTAAEELADPNECPYKEIEGYFQNPGSSSKFRKVAHEL